MEMSDSKTASAAALRALSALAQEHRLAIFRLLVRAGREGLSAGNIADALDLPPSSLSFHLSHLRQGGLIQDERQGRSILYRADFAAMDGLIAFLLENCCDGDECDVSRRLAAMTDGGTF